MKRVCLSLVLLAVAAMAGNVRAEEGPLFDYITKDDPSFSYEVEEVREQPGLDILVVRLTSQTWRGVTWRHWLTVLRPAEVAEPSKALLFITGGSNNDEGPDFDSDEARVLTQMARSTKSVVSIIEQVPNQPLFDGLYEDEIISLTFEKFIETGEKDWPLLLPMAKSAVRAMDAVQAIARERYGQEVESFMTAGASKRGWTTWLAAVADPRVKVIAPMVIDVLNMPEQMDRQVKSYGGYSEQIHDYTDRGIQEVMDTPEGEELLAIVDPYSYLDRLTLPKLVLLGTNDRYWTVDAARLYYGDLQGPKWLRYETNAGHGLGYGAVAAIWAFYDAFVDGWDFPAVTWQQPALDRLRVNWERTPSQVRLWTATSESRDFRESKWDAEVLAPEAGGMTFAFEEPESGWKAYYVEAEYQRDDGLPYTVGSEITVLPEAFPERQASTDNALGEPEGEEPAGS